MSILVSVENGHDLAYCKIKEVDRKTTIDIYNIINSYVQKIKRKIELSQKITLYFLSLCPAFLITVFLAIFDFIANNIGCSWKCCGYEKYPFGSMIITNVGNFGYESLFAPIPFYSGALIALTIGSIVKKPKVVNDKLEIRETITISVTIDHRFSDGARDVKCLNKFMKYVEDPEKYLDDRMKVYEEQHLWGN